MIIKNRIAFSALIFFILSASMLLYSCSQSKNAADNGWYPKGMKLASTDAVDYNLFVPESWTVDISAGMISAYAGSADLSNISMAAFNLKSGDANITAAEYWSSYEEKLKVTFPDMEYVSASLSANESSGDTGTTETSAENAAYEPEKTVLGGVEAYKYVYTATVTGDKYKFMQVICVRAGYTYIFTYTALPEKYDSHIEEVGGILENFSFTD